jgi:predicted dehydrogenase
MVRVGVIGYGYWGPNVVRNFNAIDGSQVVAVCDRNTAVVTAAAAAYPGVRTTPDHSGITRADDVDLVAIVTPVSTHYELALEALSNGKHVFVEKPFTATVAQAEELCNLAERKNLAIMVDHTFTFTGAVRKIREIMDQGLLGTVYYYDATRVNLGLFQHDVNVIWDLAPHDFSILSYLIDEKPVAVSASGVSHVNAFEDVAYISVYYQSNLIAHINVNWLSPVKVRNTLVGGMKRMLLWNDLAADEKIKVYDKGVNVNSRLGVYELLVSYRSGDMWAPRVDATEALRLECRHLIECIEQGRRPRNSGEEGLQVVRMLKACDISLRSNAQQIPLTF